jgi:hypothetical protein
MSVDLTAMPLGQIVTAIGGLGTAAFGLVDALKAAFGGINRIGLGHIQSVVSDLVPDQTGDGLPAKPINALPRKNILESVAANWVNGTDVGSQKAIAKSLIKLHMSAGNAKPLAEKTNVDPDVLASIAGKISTGTSLTQQESDVYSRFDLIVTSMLDEAYQLSDQDYRNKTRALAGLLAILLALAAAWSMSGSDFSKISNWGPAVLVGLLATPLAPVAKDLSSALATAVNAMQAVKKK